MLLCAFFPHLFDKVNSLAYHNSFFYSLISILRRRKEAETNPMSSSYRGIPETAMHISAHGLLINWNRAIKISGGHAFRHRKLNYVTAGNRLMLCCLLEVLCAEAPEGFQ
jgi:hypothetical protein